VIIEASMAQAEGGSVSDYPKIAEVINNRLKINMALQFDSVLLYGLNKYAINVTDAQIATPGPYNDFEHTGLPPGPISNPGDAAIQGILHPDTGNWLYFLTVTGGKSEFSHSPLAGQ
jgi:cell division protein YceG involved in septum cleavage